MTSAQAGPVVPTPADLAPPDRLMNVGDPDSDAVVDDLSARTGRWNASIDAVSKIVSGPAAGHPTVPTPART